MREREREISLNKQAKLSLLFLNTIGIAGIATTRVHGFLLVFNLWIGAGFAF
jgi:hypothetical protein